MRRMGAELIRVAPLHPFHLWSIASPISKLNSPGDQPKHSCPEPKYAILPRVWQRLILKT